MDRRTLYRLVAEACPNSGKSEAGLAAVAEAMDRRRKFGSALLPASLQFLSPLLDQDDLLGQIYQAINAPALETAYRATARDRRKFSAEEIPKVTQLFTPKWVVEFLLQNTLGALWLEMHPDSRLGKRWVWLKNQRRDMGGTPMLLLAASELRICDPACGTMNFGLVAMDMLRDMYREEMKCAGNDGWPAKATCRAEAEIDASIVRNNLIGFDIDPMAIELAKKSLEIKIGSSIPAGGHRLLVKDTLFDPGEVGDFHVVVTNPPYLSARNLDAKVVAKLKRRYPAGWRDYYACFMLRSLELLRSGGWLGILSMQSFIFTGAFERMRRELAEKAEVRTAAHFGPGLFDVGNPGTLQTAAVVMQKKPVSESPAVFFRLVDAVDKREALAEARGYELRQSELAALPRGAWMYWICPGIRRAFSELPRLGDVAPPRQGLATTDNARFVRYWWETEKPEFAGTSEKWKPYAKGGRFRRWYERARHRVNWEDDGREIKQAIIQRYPYLNGQWRWVAKNSNWYGKEGITYSYLTSGCFSARRLEAGTIFDVAGSSLFPHDPLAILGILNSGVVRQFLSAINPTVNFQVGDLRQLPIPRDFPQELRECAGRAINCTRRLDSFDETSPDFAKPAAWNREEEHQLRLEIAKAQGTIDDIARQLYGVAGEDSATAVEHGNKTELARRWISYALGIWLGRWGEAGRGNIALLSPLNKQLRNDLLEILRYGAGEAEAGEIVEAAGGLERFLGRDFLPWHNQLYRGRPVCWGFAAGEKTAVVHGFEIERGAMGEAFRDWGKTSRDVAAA